MNPLIESLIEVDDAAREATEAVDVLLDKLMVAYGVGTARAGEFGNQFGDMHTRVERLRAELAKVARRCAALAVPARAECEEFV